jgi:hypothetical protein
MMEERRSTRIVGGSESQYGDSLMPIARRLSILTL